MESVATKQTRRPTPPPGFVRFKWKRAKCYKDACVYNCPHCKTPDANPKGNWGRRTVESGFTDPVAELVAAQAAIEGYIWCGALDRTWTVEDTPLLCHWSRYALEECIVCGGRIWHDLSGNDWHYYYNRETEQLNLFAS